MTLDSVKKTYLDNTDDDVFQSWPVGVVVEDQSAVFRAFCAPEGRSAHARIQGAQMIVQGVQVLQNELEVSGGSTYW